MFDSHTLQVDVTAQFSQNAATSKSITVNTTINGVALQSILPLTSVTGTQSRSLFIDLAANNPQVPRFTDNQVFDVTATATENGAVVGTATKTGAEIPLPVVHVHGILTDCLGDRIPHSLFSYLKSIHPAYVEDDGVSDGTANNMLTPATHPYPTLVSFDYQSMKESVRLTGAALAAFIQSQVLANTWAAKVDVVAHSMGGIITRSAIAINGQGAYINRLILVGSPSEGSTLAPIALSFWGPSAKLVGLLLQQMIPGLDFVSVLNCIENGNQTTTQELLPTYPWYAGSASAVQGGQFPQPQPNPNPTLPTINQAGLDPRVAYYAIVASGEPTVTYLWGRSQLWPTDIASYSDFTSRVNAWGTGDGIVPIRSQRASDTSWPIGALRGQLNIFPDVGPVFHTAYFDQFQVQIDVETILWP
jgi:pimeloyl-ACP methyl ester carboxylesterase